MKVQYRDYDDNTYLVPVELTEQFDRDVEAMMSLETGPEIDDTLYDLYEEFENKYRRYMVEGTLPTIVMDIDEKQLPFYEEETV